MSNDSSGSQTEYSGATVVLIGIAAMLLTAVLYVAFGFGEDM